jgi:hypothetical protein
MAGRGDAGDGVFLAKASSAIIRAWRAEAAERSAAVYPPCFALK